MTSAFVIDQVSWHTATPGNPETREQVIRRFETLLGFLERNQLFLGRPAPVDDDFSIASSDLTDDGLAVMKAAYDKWLRRIDRGGDPQNVDLLERALQGLKK